MPTLQSIMAMELVALLLQGSWAGSVWLLAILFVFSALFLGKFHSYYERFFSNSPLRLVGHLYRPLPGPDVDDRFRPIA